MSHKTADSAHPQWRFDLVSEATGVPFVYPHHQQTWLYMPYSDESETINTTSLVHEDGLKTAVINSLFLDRRAEADDPVPDHIKDMRGWAGDDIFVANDHWGSKLWMLPFIGKQSREVGDPLLAYSKKWTEQALQWFVDDGLADYIKVTTWYPRAEKLRIHIEMYQNDNLIYRGQWERFRDDIANSGA